MGHARTSDLILDGLRAEAAALVDGVHALTEAEWELPTRCEPWSVRELLGHVSVAVDRVPGMLAEPAPAKAEVSAAEYYRPDRRFDAATNAARVQLAKEQVEHTSGPQLADRFEQVAERVDELCRAEPADRVVRTRHGDPMLLSDFLLTRIVEVCVHGLDLSDALGREPWLTAAAGDVLLALLVGENWPAVDELGWGRAGFVRRATGREPLTAEESAALDRLGIRWLALG